VGHIRVESNKFRSILSCSRHDWSRAMPSGVARGGPRGKMQLQLQLDATSSWCHQLDAGEWSRSNSCIQ
jgi:hypothetical protein